MTFEDLGITKDFCKGLLELGIKKPTLIQQKVIPLLLKGSTDIVGKAQTGTGKTAAFGLPLLSLVDPKKEHVQGLVLAPTRELGQQIAKQLFKFTKYTDKIFTEALYGGEKIDIQIKRLQRPTHIVVATPGRLIDLIKRKSVDLSKIKTVILDEADEMLSMGFQKDLDTILSYTKGHRSIWLFSATMPKSLEIIVAKHIHKDAIRISADKEHHVNQNIAHQFVVCDVMHKLETLTYFLKSQANGQGILFTKTKVMARKLCKDLGALNYNVGVLEGDMTQKDRDKVMRAFKKKTVKYLVSTDVSARGIDVANLNFVAHFELPDHFEYYVHRSGRTARAGKQGISMAFVTNSEVKVLRALERELKIKFNQIR